MKCKNCGTENHEKEQYCKKCGKYFYELTFKEAVSRAIFNPNWLNVGLGVTASFIILVVFYGFMDAFDIFVYGMIPALLVGGAVTGILFYNRNIRANYDYVPSLSGAVTGLITGFVVLVAIMAQYKGSNGLILFIYLPGYVFWGFVGGALGTIVNMLRKENIKLIIPLAVFLILILSVGGYFLNQSNMDNKYETAYSNQLTVLSYDNLLQPEADTFLKASSTQKKMSNLKEAQKRYQRMQNITKDASLWNNEMINDATSDMKKEYAKALGQYINLKLDYYDEIELGIESSINGNSKEAQKHYQNAENLAPEIQSQENLIATLINKDPQFKQYVDQKIAQFKEYAEYDKEKGELMTFPFVGPDS